MRSYSLFALAGLSVSLLLTGCGFGSQGVDLGLPSGEISGRVMGGQSPIAGSTMSIYAFGSGGYGLAGSELATTTSKNDGSFTFNSFPCPQSNTPLYMLSSGGNTGGGNNPSAVLAVTLGPCGSLNGIVNINEVTTAATAFTLAHYFNEINSGYTEGADFFGGPSTSSGGIINYSQGIINATTVTIPHIVNTQAGFANSNVNAAPGSIVESAKIYTIANILAACVNTTGPTSSTETTTVCGQLFGYTMDYQNVRPFDTLQAAVQMALFPAAHVKNLYNLIPPIGFSFGGYLTSVPQDFSIGISYTTATAGLAVPTGTISTLDIDANGGIWFPSNGTGNVGVVQFTAGGSTNFFGPYNSTNMVNPTQVSIDATGVAWLNDLGSNFVAGYPIANPTSPTSFPGTVGNVFTAVTINYDDSVVLGFTTAANVSQVAVIDPTRKTFAGQANSAVSYPIVSIAGDPVGGDSITTTNTSSGSGSTQYYYGPSSSFTPFIVSTDAGLAGQTIFQGKDIVAVNTGLGSATDDLCVFSTQNCFPIYPLTQRPTNLAIDGESSLWATAGSAGSVLQIPQYSTFAPGGTSYLDTNFNPPRAEANELFHGTGNGGTMVQPAGVAVDVAGNVWVSNAGCTTTGCTPSPFVLSEVIGAAAPTITPLISQIITNTTLTGTEPQY